MLRRALIALCVLFVYSPHDAQDDPGSTLISRGAASAFQSDYYQAAKYYTQAKEFYLRSKDYHKYIDCEFLLIDCLLKSSNYLESAQRLAQLKAFVQTQQPSFRKTFMTDTMNVSLALFEIEFLTRTGNIAQSINALRNLYTDVKLRNDQDPSDYKKLRLIQISTQLALAYSHQGDCDNSKTFSMQSIAEIAEYRHIYLKDGAILQPYLLLARCYANSRDTIRAKYTYDTMLKLLAEISTKKSQRAFELYLEIFDFYLQSHQLDSAYTFLTRLQTLDTIHQHRAEILQLTGDYSSVSGNIEGAEKSYLNALAVILRLQGEKSEAIARCYLSLGEIYLREHKPDVALKYFHQGVYSLSDLSEVPGDLIKNPPLSSLYSQRTMLRMLKRKAAALDALFGQSGNPVYHDGAWHTIRLAVRFMDGLRSGYSAETDKSLLVEDSYPVFEHAIALAYDFHHLSGEIRWIDSAFILMEESKALNLRDAVLHGQARRFAGIPDSLLQLENTLRLEIAGKERLIREYRNSSYYLEATEVGYMQELAVKKDQYRQLIARYEGEHPKYYALKHKPIAIAIAEIRESLVPGQTMLEYFIGDSAIYLLRINMTGQQLYRIAKDFPLEAWVSAYRGALHDFASGKSMLSLTQYAQAAHDLYRKLLPEDIAGDHAMLIVPDGVLGYLSFSSLLRTYPEDLSDIRDYDYLLWHHDISYSYSANLYLELHALHSASSGNALVCAPHFGGLTDISSLQHNDREARNIRKLTRGQLLSGEDCTIPAFLSHLSNEPYGILHLATHGSANDESGDASYLVFSGEPANSAILYARDLYNLDMPFNLVYLSACETGTGELRRGEGIISLARAFFYAGVQSLVTTLWRVEDSRSAQLSEAFYRHLQNGTRKDSALSAAQRDYLHRLTPAEKVYAHPVYWSALIPVGNMQAIEFGTQSRISKWFKVLFICVGLFLFILVILRVQQR